jgi:alpha-N-arabinofuranosidase
MRNSLLCPVGTSPDPAIPAVFVRTMRLTIKEKNMIMSFQPAQKSEWPERGVSDINERGGHAMIKKRHLFIGLFTVILLISTVYAQKTENKLIVNVDLGKDTISRHIYGHFAEHLGRCIYGGFWVGEESPIPNTAGIRNDVVKALLDMKIPNLRWPGGCFADEYHWMDGIGPKDQRPTMINTHWGGVTEDNSFGTHEFMELCEQLGCEPVICGNLGSGTVREMSQWIEYLNSDNISPMTRLRKKNGRDKPWNVKFWGIGNENWGCGGNMTPEFYADQMRRYSTYCRNYGDNRLYRIACGPSGSDYYWMDVLMRDPGNRRRFQGISLHSYTGTWGWENSSATKFQEKFWFKVLEEALKAGDIITKQKVIMDRFDPAKVEGLVVDEWGTWYDVEPGTNPGFLYQQNTLRDALVASLTFDIFNKNCDRVKMANIAQTVNVLQAVILTKDDQIVLTPTYYAFKMYKVHQDATLLPIDLTCEKYDYDDDSIPSLSASASRSADGLIHITMSNLNPNKEIRVTCELRGIDNPSFKRGEIITGKQINSYNDFGKAEEVKIEEFKSVKINNNVLTINLPAKSIVLVEL